jgi:quercetin dioxygenase-like cupin family protein
VSNPPVPVPHLAQEAPWRWRGVAELRYNETPGSPFSQVTRHILADEEHGLGVQVRYFEIAPGGHTTLEHHGHPHIVVPVRGAGRMLIADTVYRPALGDLLYVPGWAWHQLRADDDAPFGFICLVTVARDRPILPNSAEIAALEADPAVAEFIRY